MQESKLQISCLKEEKQRQCNTIEDLRRESEVKEATLLCKEEELRETTITKQLLQVNMNYIDK